MTYTIQDRYGIYQAANIRQAHHIADISPEEPCTIYDNTGAVIEVRGAAS